MVATYQHPIRGRVRLDFAEALRLLRKVADAYGEVIEQIYEYDEEHPELWDTCSEHPEGECGQRDLPRFFATACMTTCDVRDAQAFLAAADKADT